MMMILLDNSWWWCWLVKHDGEGEDDDEDDDKDDDEDGEEDPANDSHHCIAAPTLSAAVMLHICAMHYWTRNLHLLSHHAQKCAKLLQCFSCYISLQQSTVQHSSVHCSLSRCSTVHFSAVEFCGLEFSTSPFLTFATGFSFSEKLSWMAQRSTPPDSSFVLTNDFDQNIKRHMSENRIYNNVMQQWCRWYSPKRMMMMMMIVIIVTVTITIFIMT